MFCENIRNVFPPRDICHITTKKIHILATQRKSYVRLEYIIIAKAFRFRK